MWRVSLLTSSWSERPIPLYLITLVLGSCDGWMMAKAVVSVVQKPVTTVSLNSNPIIMILQTEIGFVNTMSLHSVLHLRRSSQHWRRKRLWLPVKGKRSNGRLVVIPLC
ncbi:hypothetical protein TNCV_3904791 [Trichonephila clavipes]|nr:hypothetical protein TNCV_3904791 [Trichonephila clavipes]